MQKFRYSEIMNLKHRNNNILSNIFLHILRAIFYVIGICFKCFGFNLDY